MPNCYGDPLRTPRYFRGGSSLSIIINTLLLFQQVNLSLWRKYNVFRPYLFNSTLDFCNYMARSNTKLSFENVFFDALRRGSNLNHSCPYSVSRVFVLQFHLHFISVCFLFSECNYCTKHAVQGRVFKILSYAPWRIQISTYGIN